MNLFLQKFFEHLSSNVLYLISKSRDDSKQSLLPYFSLAQPSTNPASTQIPSTGKLKFNSKNEY